MVKCPKCDVANEDGASACFLCGQELKRPGILGRLFGKSGEKRSRTPNFEPDEGVATGDRPQVEQPVPDRDGATPPFPQDAPQDAESFKDQAKEYIEQGQYQRAIQSCGEAIRLDPQQGDAYYNRGLAYIRLGLYERAIEDFDQAIHLNPRDADAHYNRGFAFLMRQQPEQALRGYNEAVGLDPNNATNYVGRGSAYHDMGQFQRSIDDFSEAIRLDPEDGYAYNNRAWCYISLGKYDEAEQDIQEASNLDVDTSEAEEELERLVRASGLLETYPFYNLLGSHHTRAGSNGCVPRMR